MPLSVYVHVPFCHVKCGYCDFNSFALSGEIVDRFVDAVIREISTSEHKGSRVETVFFGGGTPTFLSGEQLARILAAVCSAFEVGGEITSEANPGSVALDQLRTMRSAGFNRISFGAQSFDSGELKIMDRIHSPDEIGQAVRWAREAGFENLNLDLIYALPGQAIQRWRSNLKAAIALNPEHLSLYCLTLEPNTRFYHDYQKGLLTVPDEDVQIEMQRLAESMSLSAGYRQYEISNYAKPGFECEHNLVYWRNQDYVGFGPGAVSGVDGCRWTNIKHPREYVARVENGENLAFESERLEGWARVGETIMLGLRLNKGIDLEALESRFGLPVRERFAESIQVLAAQDRVCVESSRLRLTDEGRLWASEIAQHFL